jgi:hypothetical protein
MAALIPHRDSRKILRAYSGELFAGGFTGAWAFPWAAPLALLSRPLEDAELSTLARTLREKNLAHGKFKAGSPARLPLPDFPGAELWGPELDLGLRGEDFGPSAASALSLVFHRPLLACTVLYPEDPTPPLPPPLSFSAAAVANLVYRPLEDGAPSFAWEIGELHWLPAIRREQKPRKDAPE